jgi:ethylmalonyl-CoA/methylmalonyl-CoA decarboxylase
MGAIRLFLNNGIAEVHLVGSRKNALSLSMMHDFGVTLDTLHSRGQELYGLILSGENNTFCTGFDIKSLDKVQDSGKIALEMSSIMHMNFMKFASLPMVTIAAIEGYAIGGGAELAA